MVSLPDIMASSSSLKIL